MKTLQQHIEEKLIINKNFKNMHDILNSKELLKFHVYFNNSGALKYLSFMFEIYLCTDVKIKELGDKQYSITYNDYISSNAETGKPYILSENKNALYFIDKDKEIKNLFFFINPYEIKSDLYMLNGITDVSMFLSRIYKNSIYTIRFIFQMLGIMDVHSELVKNYHKEYLNINHLTLKLNTNEKDLNTIKEYFNNK